MPSRYWLPYVAAAGLALAVGAYAQPVSENAGSQSGPSEAQAAPESHPEPSSHEAIQSSIARIAAAIEAIAAKNDPPEKEAREESDLRAQWEMAKWAEYVAWTGAAQAVLTFFGLVAIYLTLGYTRRAVKEAAAATEAAKEAVHVTELAAERQLRAYIVVESGKVIEQDKDKNIRFEARPIFRNTGQTPARNVNYRGRVHIVPFPLPADFDFTVPNTDQPSVATVGAGLHKRMFIVAPRYYGVEELRRARAADGIVFCVYGTVYYDDVFDRKHWANFCFIVGRGHDGEPMLFATNRHNDST